jgi:hypothetical protein
MRKKDKPLNFFFNFHGSVHRNNYSKLYVQQHAMLHGIIYPETALHVSGGTTTLYQERKQLYLQHLVTVTPYCCLLLSWKIWNRFECATVHN